MASSSSIPSQTLAIHSASMNISSPRVIYWFRTDLRLHDSPALKVALDLQPDALWPIWTWDPHYVYRARVGVNRWQFLIDCQNDLSKSISQLNKNSKLFLVREAPQTLFPKLFKAWRVTHLVFEKDTDAYARDRDAEVMKLAKEAGVEVIVRSGRTLWDSDELAKKNHGKPTMSITQVQTAGPKVGPIPRPIPPPSSLPDPGELTLDFQQQQPDQAPDLNHASRSQEERSYSSIAGPNNDFAIPTLEELGFPPATTSHRGGETIALTTLAKITSDTEYTATFSKPQTAPTAFSPPSTTLLSPHLHFGSLSVREFYWRVQDVLKSYKGKHTEPPTSLIGQLLFRDMYFGAQAALGHVFAQTVHNSHCRFIPWHLPTTISPITKLPTGSYRIDSPLAEKWLQRWKYGLTGFPWIDALMRQLRQEGWIHHLGRHVVACFLTRGGCYISWERGAEVFEEWLLDHEVACNVGNWQWLSCTAFFSQFFRVYSPMAFPAKWDKEGEIVRRYVPELKNLDKKFIFEPWKAPEGVLRKAGVRIEGDGEAKRDGIYPTPMFDFGERRTICMAGMKKAYEAGLMGSDERVVDGTLVEPFAEAEGSAGKGEKHDDRVEKGSRGGSSRDGAVEDDENGAREKGGEAGKDEKARRGVKRKKGQMTLDAVFKRAKE